MNNKQLVTEKIPCVAAISLAEAKDYVIPGFKAIIRLKARFRTNNDISVRNEGFQYLSKQTLSRFDICLRSTTKLRILENKNA